MEFNIGSTKRFHIIDDGLTIYIGEVA